jgi:hypothetical protein
MPHDVITLPPPDLKPMENGILPSPAITLSQIKPRPLEWLWPGWLALGKLAVVDGDPEQGKSFVLLDLAARLSRGAAMPDERDGESETENRRNGDTANIQARPSVDVTMLIAEDSLEDTVFPRLEAAGADLSRIHILKSIPRRVAGAESSKPRHGPSAHRGIAALCPGHPRNVRPPTLPRDLLLVEQVIHQTHSRLLLIDPGLADLDRHCLCLLADLADRHRCAIVLQRYLNKWTVATRAICRGGGSMSVIGAARTAMLLARDPREVAVRILASTKNNYGPRPPSLRFVLEPVSPGVCRVNWLGSSPLTADDLLGIQTAVESKTAIAHAMKFLKEFLEDGPKATDMCYTEARKNHIAPSTLRCAKLRLGIATNQKHNLLGLFVPATWELPNGRDKQPPLAPSNGATVMCDALKSNDDEELR